MRDALLLQNYQHLAGYTFCVSGHAICAGINVIRANLAANEIPQMLASRLVSVRGLHDTRMIVAADVIEGTALGPGLEGLFAKPEVAFVHIHFAERGCFAASATRM